MTESVETVRAETPPEKTPGVYRPRIGDRIELGVTRRGIRVRGTVHYVDDLQILIKWDDGRSESLRSTDDDGIRILPADDT
jgi:hypothetical protein